ncbi:MAG TPA: aminoglycoside phosphotransferase family protein [Kribbella sp.]|nr:aminoglycoside phosphotransferase family protein [Kribbella sp.]
MAVEEDVRRLLASQWPGYRIDEVVLLGSGTDNLAYEVNDELIVRIGTEADPVRVDREARLLSIVAEVSPLAVPRPAFTVPELGCLAYFKVPGVPLLDVPHLWSRTSIPAALGGFLATLHAVPMDRLVGLVEPDVVPPADWLQESADYFTALAERIPAERHAAIASFLWAAPPEEEFEPAFSHHDLGIEHVLVGPTSGAVTGIIDWGDAALVDPAYDFGLIYRDLGPEALTVALSHYPDPGIAERAGFYARCSVLEDLAYGIEADDHRYVDKSLAALDWLFGKAPTPPP